MISKVFISLLLSIQASASIPHSNKLGDFFKSGYVIGGHAGKGFSLIGLQNEELKSAEHYIFSIGDMGAQASLPTPCYFHVKMDPKIKRLSLDLNQVSQTLVDQKDLDRVLKNSKFVSKNEISFDAQEFITNVSLYFKKNVEAKVWIANQNEIHILLREAL